MKAGKRAMSFLLVMLLLAGIVSTTIAADNEEPTPEPAQETVAEAVTEAAAEPVEEPTPEPTETPADTAAEEARLAAEQEEYLAAVSQFPKDYEYVDMDVDISLPRRSAVSGEELMETGAGLESAYSGVTAGKTTSVKNQGSYPTCWVFSANAVAESSLLAKGGSALDLSEVQLPYFMFGEKYDPLGNATGDKSTLLYEKKYYQVGCNHFYSMWALAGWTNGALEETLSYSRITQEFGKEYNYDYDVAHLQNALIIPFDATVKNSRVTAVGGLNDVKQAIKQYGGVAVSYLVADDLWYYNEEDYNNNINGQTAYSTKYHSYYCSTKYYCDDLGGHAVTLVGWNDAFPKEYFDTTAPGNGAWLVKNSWGNYAYSTDGDTDFEDYDTSAQEGYFWISYYDLTLSDYYGEAYVFDFDTTDKYDNNYQYDGSCGYKSFYIDSGTSVGATYEIAADDLEVIKGVGFGTYTTDVSYSLQLYKVASKGAKPTSGTPLLSTPVTGTTTYAGFYTVEIPENLQQTVKKGDIIAAVFTLTASERIAIAFDGEQSSASASVSYEPVSTNDYTFKLVADATAAGGYKMTSYKGSKYTLRVKMYTKNATVSEAEFTDTGRSLSLDDLTYVNQYCTIDTTLNDDYIKAHGGLLVWGEELTEEEATFESAAASDNAYRVEGLLKVGDEFYQQSQGVAPRNFGTTFYLRLYLQLEDGSYVYSPLKTYSINKYCENMKKTYASNQKTLKLINAMLTYGEAAEEYFE